MPFLRDGLLGFVCLPGGTRVTNESTGTRTKATPVNTRKHPDIPECPFNPGSQRLVHLCRRTLPSAWYLEYVFLFYTGILNTITDKLKTWEYEYQCWMPRIAQKHLIYNASSSMFWESATGQVVVRCTRTCVQYRCRRDTAP